MQYETKTTKYTQINHHRPGKR